MVGDGSALTDSSDRKRTRITLFLFQPERTRLRGSLGARLFENNSSYYATDISRIEGQRFLTYHFLRDFECSRGIVHHGDQPRGRVGTRVADHHGAQRHRQRGQHLRTNPVDRALTKRPPRPFLFTTRPTNIHSIERDGQARPSRTAANQTEASRRPMFTMRAVTRHGRILTDIRYERSIGGYAEAKWSSGRLTKNSRRRTRKARDGASIDRV